MVALFLCVFFWLRKSGQKQNRNQITWNNQVGMMMKWTFSYIFFHEICWKPSVFAFSNDLEANRCAIWKSQRCQSETVWRAFHSWKGNPLKQVKGRRCWMHDENMITWYSNTSLSLFHYYTVLISAWKLSSAKRSENQRTGTATPFVSDRRCLHPFLQWTMQMILSDWQLRQKIVIATRWRRFVAGGSSDLQILEPLQDGWKAADSLHC